MKPSGTLYLSLSEALKIFCWIFISTLLLTLIFGIHESLDSVIDLSEFYEYKLSPLRHFWIMLYTNTDAIVNFLCYTPALILAGLLYWAVRINKKISS